MGALVRGVLTRKRTNGRHARWKKAATNIQRVQRGRALRQRMWNHITEQKATKITAAARGFLERTRRLNLVAKVILIQRRYRRWLKLPREEREVRRQHMMHRKAQATKIQKAYRQHAEKNMIRRIQAATIG